MKFFTVAAVSFSLGCQVFAAPIEVPSAPIPAPVAGIAAHLETVAGGAVAGAEALPPVSALTTAAAPITPNTGLPIVKKSIDITTITTSISSLKSSVSPELSAIMSFSASNVTTYAVPAIKSHLETIATHIHETVITLGPALVGSGEALAVGEAEALLEALADLESLVFSIKSTFSSTLAIVKSDVAALIQPEIATVLGLVLPLLGPVTTFVYSIAGLVPGGDAAAAQLTTAAGSVMAVAGPLLGPVAGLAGGVA